MNSTATRSASIVPDRVRIAVLGFGLIGQRHAQLIEAHDACVLSAVVDSNANACDKARSLGYVCYGSLEEMLLDSPPDAIVIASPTPAHMDHALCCIDARLPVLIEKPIASSVDEAQCIVNAARERGVAVLVGHHRRHNPIIQRAKMLLANGAIGKVRAVHAQCWFYKPDTYFDAAPWRKRPGAGPVLVNLVHDIDSLRYLCGDIVSVQAQCTKSTRGYDNEDVAVAMLRFENDVLASVTVSDSVAAPWSWEMTSGENSQFPSTDEHCYMIGGAEGSLTVPDLKLWRHENDAPDWLDAITAVPTSFEAMDPLVLQLQNFVEVVRKQNEPLVSALEGTRSLSVIEAIQRAAKSGKPEIPVAVQ